jgi:putative sigma-54 modulation protein
MNIAITFRQMDATEAVKAYATEKVAKLQKFLRKPMKSQVTLSVQKKTQHSVEIDVHSGQEHYHAHETLEDMYGAIDKVIGKLEAQIRGVHSEKLTRRKGADRASERLLVSTAAEEE